MFYDNCNHYTVPTTSQSEVTAMQSDDNQPRQDGESSQVEHTNGVCISIYVCGIFIIISFNNSNLKLQSLPNVSL